MLDASIALMTVDACLIASSGRFKFRKHSEAFKWAAFFVSRPRPGVLSARVYLPTASWYFLSRTSALPSAFSRSLSLSLALEVGIGIGIGIGIGVVAACRDRCKSSSGVAFFAISAMCARCSALIPFIMDCAWAICSGVNRAT